MYEKTTPFEEEESAFSSRQQMSQINENDDKFAKIGLEISSTSTVFSRLG